MIQTPTKYYISGASHDIFIIPQKGRKEKANRNKEKETQK